MKQKLDNPKVNKKIPKTNNKGASMLEYALLAALIAVVCIVAIRSVGLNSAKTNAKVFIAMCCASKDEGFSYFFNYSIDGCTDITCVNQNLKNTKVGCGC